MSENLLPSSESLRGVPSTFYFIDVKSDFRPLNKQTAPWILWLLSTQMEYLYLIEKAYDAAVWSSAF